jgi:pyruvate kinase
MNGGHLQARPGLHLPAERISLPVPTDEDRMLIRELAIPQDVDFVAVSFVRNASEIHEVRALLGDSGIRIIAKIETPHALENLEEIVVASDAVMVARGDLGTECPFEDVPVYQKRIIRTCLANAKPVITATQMMESMITASTPTRAEASDVANAVCDGTDAIMLSGETAVGHNPALVVQAMAKIADAAEIVADFDRFALTLSPDRQLNEITVALTHGAWWAMNDLGVKAVLCCTRTGSTAHAMAALRPEAKLIALSTSAKTVRQEALTWGVESLALPETTNSDSMVAAAAERAKEAGLVQSGDLVGILSGGRDVAGATNDFRLITIA